MNDFLLGLIKKFLYGIVVFLIITFIIGKIFVSNYLLSFTNFESSQGIWLLFIILIFSVHLPELRVLVKEIIKDKLQNYTGELMYEEMKNRTLGDSKYIFDIDNKINNPKTSPIIQKNVEESISSGSTL